MTTVDSSHFENIIYFSQAAYNKKSH
uniref:Uncharacterized protein n=1 Tax=Arundo donax TaxID=35708 RepID=A0A0A8YKD3_ARUDO